MEFFVIVTINKFKLPHVGPKQISLDVLGAWFPRPANENFPRAAFSDKRGDLRFEFVVGDRGRLTFLKERISLLFDPAQSLLEDDVDQLRRHKHFFKGQPHVSDRTSAPDRQTKVPDNTDDDLFFGRKEPLYVPFCRPATTSVHFLSCR